MSTTSNGTENDKISTLVSEATSPFIGKFRAKIGENLFFLSALPTPYSTPSHMFFKHPETTIPPSIKRVPLYAGSALIFVACLALLGWMIGSVTLTGIAGHFPSMKINTAVALLLLGISLVLLHSPSHRIAQPIAKVAGLAIAVIAAATLLEYATGFDFGIDQILGRDTLSKAATSHPGRMAPETAWAIYFFGFSLFFLPSRSARGHWLGQVLALSAGSIALYQALSFYSHIPLIHVPHTRMALHTSVGLLLAASGLLCLQPERGIVGMMARRTAGGMLARRLFPWGFLFPIALWSIRLLGQKYQLVTDEQGFAFFFSLTFVAFTLIISSTALRLHKLDLKQSETGALFHSVIENIPNMIFLKEAEGLRFVLFNKAGERLLGYSRNDLIGKNDYDFFPADQANFFTQKDREILKKVETVDIPEEPIDTRSGKRVLHTQKISILGEDGVAKYLLGISEDITERKQNEIKLEEQRKLLIQTSKMSALGEMASGIAHEINNPLSVIYGEAEDLRELATAEKVSFEDIARIATKIEATTERIARIIKGLRSFARDSNEEPFVSSQLYHVVEDTLAFCRERFKTHGTQLEVMPIPHSLELDCRRVQIAQVLLNLLNNAFDALQNQSNRVIRIEWKDTPTEVELAVIDNGPGIPAAIHDKIFQPFFSTKEVGKGTGLGLSIAKGIAEGHHGTLTCENPAHGKGAIFRLRLPRYQAPHQLKVA